MAVFQRIMDDFIDAESRTDTFGYSDDITICGYDQVHHDNNLKKFLSGAEKKNLTYKESNARFQLAC